MGTTGQNAVNAPAACLVTLVQFTAATAVKLARQLSSLFSLVLRRYAQNVDVIHGHAMVDWKIWGEYADVRVTLYASVSASIAPQHWRVSHIGLLHSVYRCHEVVRGFRLSDVRQISGFVDTDHPIRLVM